MPTYVYECRSCNAVFEAFQSIKDEPLNTCECGAVGTVKRVIQPVGIAFKGSGFYVNDSQSSSPVAKPESEASKADAPIPPEKAAAVTPAPATSAKTEP